MKLLNSKINQSTLSMIFSAKISVKNTTMDLLFNIHCVGLKALILILQ